MHIYTYIKSSLQLRWSPWGEGFCRYKVKKWGGGPYKILNRGQIWPCILYKITDFFCPLFLVVPSFWLYKMLNLGRIFAFCPCLTPACWHWLLTRKVTFPFCRGRRGWQGSSVWSSQKPMGKTNEKYQKQKQKKQHKTNQPKIKYLSITFQALRHGLEIRSNHMSTSGHISQWFLMIWNVLNCF